MSTTLFFLVPVGMLAVVWSLCFVGACLPTTGLPGPNYSNTILKEPSLIAYWPLSDFPNSPPPTGAPALPPIPQGSTGGGTALDLTGNNHNGSYISPPAYVPGTTIPQIGTNPTLKLRQTSMLPGDAVVTGSKNLPACVDFEGGYVSIPWAANSPSLSEFTLEAWIKPGWTATNFNWVLFSAHTNIGTGFAIFINDQNQWQLSVGNGTALTPVSTFVAAPVNPSSTRYVALTFESTNGTTGTLSLWIDPDSDDPSVPPTAAFTTTATYVPVDPTQPLTFFIGAGDNQDAPRTQPGGTGAPLVPFQGLIQSVALYNTALTPPDLASHFADGAGSDT
jgi:Concanavalin A-like lectin/glucanases superfamily